MNERSYRHRRQRERGPPAGPARRAEPKVRAPHPAALSDAEKDQIVAALCEPRFVDLAPAQVYSTLLDEGVYLCSERQMYRVLAERGLVRERRRGGHQRAGAYGVPRLEADAPNKVWTWDITALRGPTKGRASYFLYTILDIFSPQGRRLDHPRSRVREHTPAGSSAKPAAATASTGTSSSSTPIAARR